MGNEAASIPEKIGNFRIVGKIGQGGMGAVFRAVHGTLERPVALKLLPSDLASNPEYVARFLREARSVAALRHDNVVQVYDAGEVDGRYFIAMELVDGCNLLKYIEDKKRISEAEGRGLLLQAARGLAAAHAKGLVHRDIKPENMLLGTDNILRLVDFGLVMESASTTQLTATGACLGTPMYMSPEQADGEHADVRTDIYSLGVTFFRVFTGQPPFTSPTVMNLLFKHKFEAPPDPKVVRPDLSQDTRNLLLHMMAKRREDRPQNAQAVVEMIEGIERGKPVPPPPEYVPSGVSGGAVTILSPGAARAAGSSRRSVLAGVAVLLAILAAGIVFAVTRPGKGEGAGPPIIEKTDAALKPDFAAKGDEAFTAGRYAEALEHYSKALAEKPDDRSLKDKLAKTEQARKFDELMQAAEALEAKGDLEAAESRYGEAARFERGAKARDRAERIRAAIAKGKGLTNKQRNAELDLVSRKAADAEKACEFEVAAEYYSRAASLSDGAVRTVFADKAQECRRQDYQAKGMAAEELKTYAEAEKWYKKALEIKADPLLQQKLEAVQQKNRPVVPPQSAVRDGQKALDAGDLARARVEFNLALTYTPGDPEATAKLNEVDGRELLAKGDAFRAAGDTASALASYTAALGKCPALEPQVTSRLQGLPTSAPVPAALIAKIDELARLQKDDDALVEVTAALRATPGGKELKEIKASLESLQACAAIYAELQKVLEAALGRVRDMKDIDSDDERARDLRDGFEQSRERFSAAAGKLRPAFLAHNYQTVQAGLTSARSDAGALSKDLSGAADTCESKAAKAAEKATAVKGPFGFSVGLGGDKKKAEKYRKLEEGFRKLAEQARTQSK